MKTQVLLRAFHISVPLMSFIGSHSGYLAWLGNARMNPDLNFQSSIIKQKGERWEVNGQLQFRRRFRPITIDLKRQDMDGEIVLNGNFQISTSDYFIGPTPSDLVATWIPIQFTMVFDKPTAINKGVTLSTN